ncbi:MAG: UDP-2,3-diacylglucosamine diphosphatase LpxI [Pseudomonadota bacterium]
MRWTKLAIITGGGALPLKLAAACEARGAPFYMIRLAGYADAAANALPGADLHLGEAGKLSRILKEEACDAIVMAGIVPRPDFSKLKLDWRAAALLPRLVAAAARGDGALLSVLVDAFEAEGVKVVGADEVAADLAVSGGVLGAYAPSDQNKDDMRKAAAIVKALGPFDVGQAAVAANGLVLAIEAAEGTDAMLDRCAQLPAALRGDEKSGVLVKRPKPGQELRVDLPTIGVETIRRAAAAGLAGVAVEEGRALLLDAEAAIAEADKAGLFVYGFSASDVD